MAGSTNQMQSRIDNGLVVATYTDGSRDTLHLYNPVNWAPIQEEYVFDDLAFWSCPVKPLRVRLDNGETGREMQTIGGDNRYVIHHGAGLILKMPLKAEKRLASLRLVTLSNDVVIGIMGITLEK